MYIFNPLYSFDNFVIGKDDKTTLMIIQAAIEDLGHVWNPLLICGESGTGKTHLLHAIGLYVQEHYPNYSVSYVSGESFLDEIVNNVNTYEDNSLKGKHLAEMYKDIDALMIDDIHGFVGKPVTQEELIEVLNYFISNNKQVILTSDVEPRYMSGLEGRLKSSFMHGIVCKLETMDEETKEAIVLKYLKINNKSLQPNEISYIARNSSNGFEIEGLVNQFLYKQVDF